MKARLKKHASLKRICKRPFIRKFKALDELLPFRGDDAAGEQDPALSTCSTSVLNVLQYFTFSVPGLG